jgi:hypothetical protein
MDWEKTAANGTAADADDTSVRREMNMQRF